MYFWEKKWQLMMRDPLCREFDQALHDHVFDPSNEGIAKKKEELKRKVQEKWSDDLHISEVLSKIGKSFKEDPGDSSLNSYKKEDFVGPFKWWSLTGEYPIVEDVKNRAEIFTDKNGELNFCCLDNEDVIYCPSHKIPILIDPTILNSNDAKKVKQEVWAIVEKYLTSKRPTEKEQRENRERLDRVRKIIKQDKDHTYEINESAMRQMEHNFSIRSKNKEWNPTLPPGEPKELAPIFRCQQATFDKYLKWYDLITAGLSIQAVAAIKKWNPIPEKQQQAFEKALNGKKKFKVGGHQRFGESTVRRGFNIIFKAIHRKKAPARERDIQREAGLPESSYQCPKHPDNRCDEKCQYYGKFLKNALRNFDDVYEEFPVGWDIEFKDTHTPYSSE